MAVREFGVRALRNHTQDVLDAVEAGDQVYLTKRGVRVAEIRSTSESPVTSLLRKAAALMPVDTGWSDELAESKRADRAAQVIVLLTKPKERRSRSAS